MTHNLLHLSSRRLFGVAIAIGALIGGLAGCGDKATSPVRSVPLTLVAQGTGGTSARYLAPAGSPLTATSAATDTIPVTFTKALLVVRDVRLVFPEAMDDSDGQTDSTGATDSLGTGEDDDVQGQVRFRGPFVIDLLSGHAARLDTMMVLPGDYARVQGHLQMLRAGDADAADYPGLVGSTVWLEGTIDGDGGGPFSFLARIDNEFQIRGLFRVAADTPATAFVAFDLSKWLSDSNGHFLDPRDLAN
ncbi:MAG TPA: hypothetical protein VI198_03270, partial [Candidatus Eisenbacteria bacterium]